MSALSLPNVLAASSGIKLANKLVLWVADFFTCSLIKNNVRFFFDFGPQHLAENFLYTFF